MDFYKFQWKMKFRFKKLKSFFKLCRYELDYKLDREGDDQFARHLIRQNLRELIKTSPEQEYLEMHGLLPDEPEDEPEDTAADPTAEPEMEPGLIRKFTVFDMMGFAIGVGSTTYFVEELKEFEDHTEISLKILEDYGEEERVERAVVPHQPGARYDSVSFNYDAFRWDRLDGKLRFLPVVYEDPAQAKESGPVRTVQDLVLRVDKALAEKTLSPLCLDYSYQCTEAGYDWCTTDFSHIPALYELRMAESDETAARSLRNTLCFYCPHYWKTIHPDQS